MRNKKLSQARTRHAVNWPAKEEEKEEAERERTGEHEWERDRGTPPSRWAREGDEPLSAAASAAAAPEGGASLHAIGAFWFTLLRPSPEAGIFYEMMRPPAALSERGRASLARIHKSGPSRRASFSSN